MGCMEWGGDIGGGGAYSYPSRRGPAPRTYADTGSYGGRASNPSIGIDDLVPESLHTDSEAPLVIACDVTGSMADWPKIIFAKLPLLYGQLEKTYLKGADPQISFAAIGDAHCDRYPLQVQPFDKGESLDERLGKLILEGGGGGQISESYELAALYYSRNAGVPNATKPIFIFIGDEMVYETINSAQASKWARTDLGEKALTKDVMNELRAKYSVYMIRKMYNGGYGDGMSPTDTKIQAQWERLLGPDRVKILPEPERVVDVILGIVAEDVGMGSEFEEELKGRQRPDQVRTVLTSLYSGKKELPGRASMRSRMIGTAGGKRTVPLLGGGDGE